MQINNPYQQPIMNFNPGYAAYQYNPMANMQRIQQEQQLPQAGIAVANQQVMPQQATGINGRVVAAVENINANEVPMDGSVAFFPKQDLSEIYVKGWNADGTIKTVLYTPHIEPKDNQVINSIPNAENLKIDLSEKATEGIMNKLDELFGKIEQLEDRFDKTLSSQKKSSRTQSKESEKE